MASIKKGAIRHLEADPPGFEPGQAEPKSAVLPLHHGSVPLCSKKADPPGFEPGLTDPESAVLPLHHGSVPQKAWQNYKITF